MDFYEEELEFEFDATQEKGLFDDDLPTAELEPEVLGIKIRLGNQPIVHDLEKLLRKSVGTLPPELEIQFEKNNLFLVTHAIGVIRTRGNAKVSELQYNAIITNNTEAKTIDLLPKSTFKKIVGGEIKISGAIRAAGNFSAEIPEELTTALSGSNLSLGGDMELELSTNARFVGKLNYGITLPVVQSSGVSSNKCTWVLNPDLNPLLGDQLMIQTVAVPKNETELIMSIKGAIKVKKGFLFSTITKETKTQIIKIKLT